MYRKLSYLHPAIKWKTMFGSAVQDWKDADYCPTPEKAELIANITNIVDEHISAIEAANTVGKCIDAIRYLAEVEFVALKRLCESDDLYFRIYDIIRGKGAFDSETIFQFQRSCVKYWRENK